MAEGFYWYWGFLDYERALYNLEKAIQLMPRNEEAWMWRGWASRRDGRWEQAVHSMQKALQINPRVHFHWIEYALTSMYLQDLDEAEAAIERARELDINHFWTKDAQARLALVRGDIGSAVRVSTGAQHGDEVGFFESYLVARILARRFDEALEAVRGMNPEFEIQRQMIVPRELLEAEILFIKGEREQAEEAARAALFRLNTIASNLGRDYRILQAEARLGAVMGKTGEALVSDIEQARKAAPVDAVEQFREEYQRARVLAMAGMAAECIALLDELLSGPNETPAAYIDADPVFDGIRNQTEFIEMLGTHR